ncbi:MAG: hypothetical protein PHY05_00935 [Methanothrix sp.]|nr:hypothetical protein [Methanothrix sp.]
MGQRVLVAATNMDSSLAVTDSQSGFRAFAPNSKGDFHFKQNGLAIESEMLAEAAAGGLRIQEVEIGVRVLVKVLFSLKFIMDKVISAEQECTLIV